MNSEKLMSKANIFAVFDKFYSISAFPLSNFHGPESKRI